MLEALKRHGLQYLMEGGLLGSFMISACLFGTLLEHPASPVRRAIRGAFQRRSLMGLAMGLTAAALIYSPWGRESGAHMNPATTLTFLYLGKVAPPDALGYVLAQFAGGATGVALSWVLLGDRLKHERVNYVVTVPGRPGAAVAWLAEAALALVLMLTVLRVSNDAVLTPYTGWFAAGLVALYITFEAPLSGMSLNPARTFASAVAARHWKALWVYFTAPVAGMLLASAAYSAWPDHHRVYCAKLAHGNDAMCIFRCEFAQLRGTQTAATRGGAGAR